MIKSYVYSMIFLFVFGTVLGVTFYNLGKFAAIALK